MTIEEIKKKVAGPDYDFLRNNEHLGSNIILLGLGGSYAYGLENPNSDVDIRGIALNSKEEVLLGQDFDNVRNNVLVETEYNGETFTYYKGAPERLIDAATKCVTLNGLETIDKDKLKMIVRSYTVKAMRVIATGYSSSNSTALRLENFSSSERSNVALNLSGAL